MTITLATLPQATAQEVYSQVRNHMLTQGMAPAEHQELISDLQHVHDMKDPADGEHCLNNLATDFNLEPK